MENQDHLHKSMMTGKRLRAEAPIFRKGRRENPGNNMIVTVTSVTEKEHLLEIHFQTQQRQEGSGLYEEADGTVSKFADCVN